MSREEIEQRFNELVAQGECEYPKRQLTINEMYNIIQDYDDEQWFRYHMEKDD